ncbi:transcriptional regulator GutM [Limoniibacter endophyticus]|uniref:Glucitol operon activator n=1 Tax=Limoniibacter endophyticus TaxID=1565040 RepID=A0A8J3GHY8_9HYPH|nr:transcriptional regulator GutM [Limoniibacter endophyticus]GHC74963.1 glucitol operon activator [Limoniibacter endophyticus]
MAIWQWCLLLMGLAWAIQSAGVWFQMRHYTDVFKGITNKYNDGFVGAGHVRGRLSKGTIVLIVSDRDLIVRRLLIMSGRSVFAKFKRLEEYEGQTVEAVGAHFAALEDKDRSIPVAVEKAIEQLHKARANALEKAEGATEANNVQYA